MAKLRLVYFLCMLWSMQIVYASDYGLRFKSHDYPTSETTQLLLNGGEPIKIGDELSLRFLVDIRSAPLFGCMLTLYTDDGQKIEYKVTLDDNMKTYSPSVMVDRRLFSVPYTLRTFTPLSGIPVSLVLNRKQNSITAGFGDKKRSFKYDLSATKEVMVNFGRQVNKGTREIVPIDLWNVEVERNGKPLYFWELRTHTDSVSVDNLRGAAAVASEPIWLFDRHTQWSQVMEHAYHGEPQFTFNHRENKLYIFTDDSLTVWNATTNVQETRAVRGGHRAMRYSTYLYVNEKDGTLYTYNLKRGTVSRFDSLTLMWDNPDYVKDEPAYMNHSQVSNGGDTLYAFGGYGFYRYNNTLYRVDVKSRKVEEIKYEPAVQPRTYMASALVGDRLYVYGGFGNEAGKQELPMEQYADLWEIDLNTRKAQRLWVTQVEDKTLNTSQMIYDAKENCFYLVSSSKYLCKIALDEPKIEKLGGKIPMELDFKLLNFNLYQSTKQQYILVVDRMLEKEEHVVEVFTIDLPILPLENEEEGAEDAGGSGTWLWWILGGALLVCLGAVGLFFVRKRKKHQDSLPVDSAKQDLEEASLSDEMMAAQGEAPEKKYYEPGKSEIRMLGDLLVIDKEGTDITSKFTKRTRNLLVLLLLNSVAKSKGIGIKALDETLWQDMGDELAARNNRNVYMRKLRVLLEEVGQVKINNDKINYKADIDKDVFFDYREACRLMKLMEEGESDSELTARTLELLAHGPLLTGMSFEWLDDLKSGYSNRALALLHRLITLSLKEGDDTQAFRIADAIMAHDPFNEEALSVQCNILCKRRTVGIAKNRYDKFCKVYEQAMDEPYGKSFADVCKG